MHKCVFCPAEFRWLDQLARHVARRHEHAEAAGRRLVVKQPWYGSPDAVLCWCQQVFWIDGFYHDAHSAFAKHLQREGGLAAHLLKLTLGMEEHRRA